MAHDVIDLDDVLERVQDDWELLMELFDIFEQDYQEKRTQLAQEVAKKDFDQIRNIAHSLKGASGNISAKAFHAILLEMEQAAVKKDEAAIQGLCRQLDVQFPELQKAIVKVKEDYQKSQE